MRTRRPRHLGRRFRAVTLRPRSSRWRRCSRSATRIAHGAGADLRRPRRRARARHPGRTSSIRCCRSDRRCRTSRCRASTARRTRRASTPATKVLAIVFESNHCPVSQLYEGRIEKLYEDYREQGRDARRDQPEQPEDRAARRAGLHGRDRLAAGDEAARAVPRHRLAVPLRRRHPGDVDEVRRRRHAAHLHLRPGPQAALPGTHRRQPARRAGEDAGRAQRDRRAARRPARAGRRDDGVRLHHEVAVEGVGRRSRSGRGSRPSRSPSTWSAPTTSRSCARTPPTRSCSCTSGRPDAPRLQPSQFFDLETTYPHVPQARLRPRHDQHQRSRRARRRAGLPEEGYASSPNKQFASADRAGAAGRLGREVEPGRAADDGDRAGRQGPLPEGREVRHPRGAPHHPRRHAGHQRLHRIEGLLDARGGGNEEEARHGVGAGRRARSDSA